MLRKFFLIDRNAALVEHWCEQFVDCPQAEALVGDYFQRPADALVSPANSFGIMDGGIDLAIRDMLGVEAERAVQAAIVRDHQGELPVGNAVVVPTGSDRWPWLIAAPTMRVPEPVQGTLNAYLAFRAVLVAAERHGFGSLACCGLGTGIGRLAPATCAMQMRAAWQSMKGPARIPSFDGIRDFHQALRRM